MSIEMITRCPNCDTSFRVTDYQLQMADGAVRCGSCLTIFTAADHKVGDWGRSDGGSTDEVTTDEGRTDGGGTGEGTTDGGRTDEGTTGGDTIDEGTTDEDTIDEDWPELPDVIYLGYDKSGEEEEASARVSAAECRAATSAYWELFEVYVLQVHAPVVEQFLPEEDPELMIGSYEAPSVLSFRWLSAAVVLLLVGIAQYGWFNIEHFAANDRYRPYCLEVCRYLPCELEDYSNPALLGTGNLLVRTHPDVADALIVDAIVRNSAAFRQRFPRVRLQFQDRYGDLVAARVFPPRQYLGGELRGLQYIPASTEVRFALEIVDPGIEAVSYDVAVVF